MTKPLALVLYENLFPGSQLVNKLDDMGYRVESIDDPAQALPACVSRKPMLLIADLYSQKGDVCDAIALLGKTETTAHIPVLAINPNDNVKLRDRAVAAGAKLVVADEALLQHLDHFLNQVLEID